VGEEYLRSSSGRFSHRVAAPSLPCGGLDLGTLTLCGSFAVGRLQRRLGQCLLLQTNLLAAPNDLPRANTQLSLAFTTFANE